MDSARAFGLIFVAGAFYLIGVKIGFPYWEASIVGFLAAAGLTMIVTGRWRW